MSSSGVTIVASLVPECLSRVELFRCAAVEVGIASFDHVDVVIPHWAGHHTQPFQLLHFPITLVIEPWWGYQFDGDNPSFRGVRANESHQEGYCRYQKLLATGMLGIASLVVLMGYVEPLSISGLSNICPARGLRFKAWRLG
ncbi:hypothetical protein D3C76_906190 [compost metagenome]